MPESGLDSLKNLETWMRERNVRRARMGDLELELADLPVASPPPPKEESDEERERRVRDAMREELNIRYAHVGGWRGTDAEIDRMMAVRR